MHLVGLHIYCKMMHGAYNINLSSLPSVHQMNDGIKLLIYGMRDSYQISRYSTFITALQIHLEYRGIFINMSLKILHLCISNVSTRFEVLTVAIIKIKVLRDKTPCRLVNSRRFCGETLCPLWQCLSSPRNAKGSKVAFQCLQILLLMQDVTSQITGQEAGFPD